MPLSVVHLLPMSLDRTAVGVSSAVAESCRVSANPLSR